MLRLEATDEEFSTFLRETCGIETNSFTVRQARNAAKGHTDLWKDVCWWPGYPLTYLPTYLPPHGGPVTLYLPTFDVSVYRAT